MNTRSSNTERTVLGTLIARLRQIGGAGYLYGSSTGQLRPDHDIDLLVILPENVHALLYSAVSELQSSCPFLLHPTVVTTTQFDTNPRIRELADSGVRVW